MKLLNSFIEHLVFVWGNYINSVMRAYYVNTPITVDKLPIACYANDVPVVIHTHTMQRLSMNYVDDYIMGLTYLNPETENKIPVIFLTQRTDTLPENILSFFIQHELGHHLQGDVAVNSINQWALRQNAAMAGQVVDCVLGADAYAASVLGVEFCVKALEDFRNILLAKKFHGKWFKLTVMELNNRIVHMKNLL